MTSDNTDDYLLWFKFDCKETTDWWTFYKKIQDQAINNLIRECRGIPPSEEEAENV